MVKWKKVVLQEVTGMSEKDVFQLKRAKYPEDVGVDSKEIVEFFEDMKENKLEFHSFMLVKNGKVACEFYREPFNKETPHAAYSVSKTLTAIAVGFAISEELISLDTPIVDIFPEYVTLKTDKRIFNVTVRNLLTMTAGIQPCFFKDKAKIDWIKDYFNSSWYGEVGTFRYVNENIFILSAIITRVAKMTLREYLKTRLFEPLGIETPYWETNKDGIEAGGWGAYLKLEDFAKIMYCLSQNGKVEKQQIIPEYWVKEMTEAHADTSICNSLDTTNGYGYCIWLNGAYENTYRANGMFSQFGIVFPEENAVFVCFGAISSEQEARDCIWRHFPKAFIEETKKPKGFSMEEFEALASKYPIDTPKESERVVMEAKLNNTTIELKEKLLLNLIGFPVSVLPFSVTFLNSNRAGNINDVNFKFNENDCEMSWREGDEKNTVLCGMNGHMKYGEITLGGVKYKVCCYAEWDENDTLKVNIRPITTVGKRKLKFNFKENEKVELTPSSTPCLKEMADSLVESAAAIIPSEFVIDALKEVTKFVPKILEPKLKGKLVNRKNIF